MMQLARSPRQIGAFIRRTRKQLGLSQKQLGEKSGLRQETISMLETGSSTATLPTVLSVLAALDLEFRIAPRSKTDAKTIERIF